MTNVGKVIDISGKYCTVEVKRLNACDMCRAECNGHCDKPKLENVTVKNTLGAKIGDKVELFTETKTVLTFAAIVFVLPVILSVMLAVILSGFIEAKYDYIISAVFFILSYIIISLIFKSKKEEESISMSKIL